MSSAATPAPSAAVIREVAAGVRAGTTLVALDFDGVLAPLVDDPATSRALPESADALARLAVADAHVALVSGRALDDLWFVAQPPPGVHLVGGHGAEQGRATQDGLVREPLDLSAERASTLTRLTSSLETLVAGSTARIERKPASVVLHTRTATPGDARRLTTAATVLGHDTGVDVMAGKDVVELCVLTVTKGDALRTLRARMGVAQVLYAGDDVTDERAFALLEPHDVTIKVGPGTTAARYRVADPTDVGRLLSGIAALAAGS